MSGTRSSPHIKQSLDLENRDSILRANTAIVSDQLIGDPTAKHVTRSERARGALTGALTGLDLLVGKVLEGPLGPSCWPAAEQEATSVRDEQSQKRSSKLENRKNRKKSECRFEMESRRSDRLARSSRRSTEREQAREIVFLVFPPTHPSRRGWLA